TGTSMGKSSSPRARLLDLVRYFANPAPAKVPRQVAMMVADTEINRLFMAAWRHRSLENMLAYHFKEKLEGGNEKNWSGLNDSGIMTIRGSSRNSRIPTQSIRKRSIQPLFCASFMYPPFMSLLPARSAW